MKRPVRFLLPISVLILSLSCVVAPAFAAVPVSPGNADDSPALAGRCTAFSWAPDSDAVAQRLVVFELTDGQSAALLASPLDSGLAEPTLELELPAGASSWSPSAGGCQERGGDYGWIIGSIGPDGAASWSAPLFFSVSQVPSQAEIDDALEVLGLARFGGVRGDVNEPVADRSGAAQELSGEGIVPVPNAFGVNEFAISSDSEVNISMETTGVNPQIWDIQAGDFGMNFSSNPSTGGSLALDTNGRVGIGDVSPDADLDIERGLIFSNIFAGEATFTTSSSRELKENIHPIEVENILQAVAKVPVNTYDWKSELFGGDDGQRTDKLGLIAEDFHGILGRGSDKQIKGQEVQMVLWLAVQELTREVEELRGERAAPK